MSDRIESASSETNTNDSVRGALAAAIAESEKEATPAAIDADEGAAEKPAKAETVETEAEGESATAKSKTEEPAKEAKTEAKEEDTDKAAAKPDAGKDDAAFMAKWSKEDREMYKGLDAKAQDFVKRRHADMEADYTRKTQQIATFRKEYDPIDQMFAPHRDVMKQKGFTPSTMVQAWYNVEKQLMEGKGVDIIKGIVSGYKIDPAKVVEAFSGGQPPAVRAAATGDGAASPNDLPPALKAELDAIKARLAREDEDKAVRARTEADDRVAKITAQIDTFKNEADKSGNLLHPHFDEVEQMMAYLNKSAREAGKPVPPLNELYESAVWATPSTREKLITAQRQTEEQKRTSEAREKAAKAQKAAKSVTGAPGNGQAPKDKPKGGSVRDAIMEAMED